MLALPSQLDYDEWTAVYGGSVIKDLALYKLKLYFGTTDRT